MCFNPFSKTRITLPPLPPPLPIPTRADPAVQDAGVAERRRLRLARGRSATILTGGTGDLSPTPSAAKTLLGQ